MKYSELLQRPEWKEFRAEFIEYRRLDGYDSQCDECEIDTEGTLRVHHKVYRAGVLPWEYEFDELRLLCKECHGRIHRAEERWRNFIRRLSPHVCYELDDFLNEIETFPDSTLKIIFARSKNLVRDIAPA